MTDEKKGPLPEDFPAREKLAEHDIKTYAQLRKAGDVTELEGIGPATAAKIAEALAAPAETADAGEGAAPAAGVITEPFTPPIAPVVDAFAAPGGDEKDKDDDGKPIPTTNETAAHFEQRERDYYKKHPVKPAEPD